MNTDLSSTIRNIRSEASHSRFVGLLIAATFCCGGCLRAPTPITTSSDSRHSELVLVATNAPTIPGRISETNAKRNTLTNIAAPPERFMVDITTNSQTTLVGYMGERPPPPWPRGNWLSFEFRHEPGAGQIETWDHWSVINIHTENLREITRRLGLKTVEMLILPVTNWPSTIVEVSSSGQTTIQERSIIQKHAYAIVTDARIPREWFHFEPSWHHHVDPDVARQIKAVYPASFRATP
jgi:hypothetical protein